MTLPETYHHLAYYTLSHPDRERFLHQHIVDAYTAQTADATTKPIGILYALIGLYLAIERGYTGKEVQRAHMQLAKDKSDLPIITLSKDRGTITAADVLDTPPGPARDAMIMQWCASVWAAYAASRPTIVAYCTDRL